MGIINRTLDASEQKEVIDRRIGGTVTGTAYPIYTAAYPSTISDARAVALGLSGTPTSTLGIQRFITGVGATTITVGGALTAVAFGTSGLQRFSLPATGSTLLNLQTGDVLTVTAAGTNAALVSLQVTVVAQAIQDVKSYF